MKKSLLFLPDISGFTKFIQTTEVEHSQHVIAELLEVLLAANTQDLILAEIEGDALFFYKENQILSQEKLLAQIETMFSAFYSHLQLLEKNRVCPCNACATAPNLQLKIIAHSGNLQFITVQAKRKPFGRQVIEVHRLMKNDVPSDNYALISMELVKDLMMPQDYSSKLYHFENGTNTYDEQVVPYIYSIIDNEKLKLNPFAQAKKVTFTHPPQLTLQQDFPIAAADLLEYITNYSYRHHWVEGVDKFEYNPNEVTRVGTEHLCVINGKHLNFITVTKAAAPEQLVYGEMTSDPPPIDNVYQFYLITPLTEKSCRLDIEIYWEARALWKKIMMLFVGKRFFKKTLRQSITQLHRFVTTSLQ